MKLNVLSDLHLNHGALAPPDNAADLVILAGDIARPVEALEWATSLAKPVLYVPGNHEYYGGSLDATAMTLRRLCEGTNVRLLDDDVVELGGVRFVGSTLWTDFMLYGAERRDSAMQEAQRAIADFWRIRVCTGEERGFTPADAAARFSDHYRFLAAALASAFAGPTVVITHHAPSARSIHPRFRDSTLNACFISDVEHLMARERVRIWIHGHTHDSFDYTVDGTRVVCNPRGYVRNGVAENPRFDANFTLDAA
jgi:predicted phosphodiesterase